MRIRRRPERPRRGWRFAVAGLAVTVVLIPGVAWADGAGNGVTAPVAPPVPAGVGGAVTGLLPGGGTDPVPGGDPTGLLPGGGGQQQAGTPAAGSNDTGSAPAGTPAPPSLPPQLQQLLDKLKSLQPSSACSDAIQADLTKLLTDIPALIQAIVTDLLDQLSSGTPPTPQELLGQLQGLLGQLQGQKSQQAADAGPPPDPGVILADLQQLVTDLTKKCAPPPPSQSSPPPPPAPGNPQPQPQPVPQPVAQPVSYPGYAPTGSIATTALRPAGDQRPAGPVPLSVLGGVVLMSAAAAVGARARARRGGR